MPSTRRRFLLSAALATGLAGCTGGESPDSEATSVEMTRVDTADTTATTAQTTGETTDAEMTTVEPRRETPESEAVRWRVAFDAPVRYQPTLGANRVYVPVGDPKYGSDEETVSALAALDRDDGTPRWTTALADAPTGRPGVHDGRAYCTTGGSDGLGLHGRGQRLVGFSRDGSERWRTEPVDSFLGLVAVAGDAYVGTRDDVLGLKGETLSAVGLTNGRTRWSAESGDVRAGRKLDETLLLEVAGGMGVAVHDAATGERRWAATGSPVGATTPVSVADDAVFVCGPEDRNEFAALELADGSQRWSYAMDLDEPFVPTAGATGGDIVVGIEYDGWVFGLDVTDGTERWTFDSGGKRGSPVIVDETVYVGGGSGGESNPLYALDTETGDEKWRFSGPSVVPFDTTDQGLLVRGSDGIRNVVAALDPEDGTERWSFETSEGLTPPVVADGRVYVASKSGVVRALGE